MKKMKVKEIIVKYKDIDIDWVRVTPEKEGYSYQLLQLQDRITKEFIIPQDELLLFEKRFGTVKNFSKTPTKSGDPESFIITAGSGQTASLIKTKSGWHIYLLAGLTKEVTIVTQGEFYCPIDPVKMSEDEVKEILDANEDYCHTETETSWYRQVYDCTHEDIIKDIRFTNLKETNNA